MNKKKFLAAALATALTVTATCIPVSAALVGESTATFDICRSRNFMTAPELEIYDILKAEIEKIVLGKAVYTDITFNISSPIENYDEMEKAIVNATDYLMWDYPEYFYWCAGYGYSYYSSEINVWFYIESEYESSSYNVSTEKIECSNQILKNAQMIARKYDNKSDYEKIMGYASEIMIANTYNLDAANNGSDSREPWDLMYVFDNDPDTNVLCEGYARAFHYLCNLGGIECYLVDGSMGGPHMWNIVVLDGVSYHADITMADDENPGLFDEYNQFVLTPAISSSAEKCEFDFKYGNHGFTGAYVYSNKTQRMYPKELLSVSTEDYASTGSQGIPVKIEINAPEKVDISGHTVKVSGNGVNATLTITDGLLDVSSLANSTYTFTFSANNCAPRAYNVTVANGTATGISNIELKLYGDINGDGKTNGTDVLKVKLLAKGGSTSDAYDRVVANVNKDNTVNGTDVLQLKLHAKGSKNLWQ